MCLLTGYECEVSGMRLIKKLVDWFENPEYYFYDADKDGDAK